MGTFFRNRPRTTDLTGLGRSQTRGMTVAGPNIGGHIVGEEGGSRSHSVAIEGMMT